MGSCSFVELAIVPRQSALTILRIPFARLGLFGRERGGRPGSEGQVLSAGQSAMKILGPFLRWKLHRFPRRR